MGNPDLFTGPDAGAYDDLKWVHEPNLLKGIRDLVTPGLSRSDSVLLDVGTGSGALLRALGGGASTVIGIDLSADMLERASKGASEAGIEPALLQADAHELPIADASVDVITMRNVLHYLSRPDRACSELRRVLKPAGVLLVAETVSPTRRTLAWWRETLLLKNPARNPALVFTSEDLSEFLKHRGFQITARRLVATQLSVLDWLNRPTVSAERRDQVLHRFLNAPDAVRRDHAITEAAHASGKDVLALRTSAVIRAQLQVS